MSEPMERRFRIPQRIEVREIGDNTQIVGHASVFFDGSEETQFRLDEDFVERVDKKAFNGALARGDDVRALFNHNPESVLGRSTSGTLRLRVDRVGLRFEIDLPGTTVGRDVAQLIERGDITGSSFGFRVTDQDFRTEDGMDIRTIRGVELFDVGPVTFPAYDGTDVGLRHVIPDDLKQARKRYHREAQFQRLESRRLDRSPTRR